METLSTFTMIGSFILFITLLCNINMMKSVNIVLLSFSIMLYMVGNYLEITNYSLQASAVGLEVRFIGIPFIPTLWYFCIREFCGLKFKKSYTPFLFMIVPCVFVYLYLTWEQNGLLISGIDYANTQSSESSGNLLIAPGPWHFYRLLYQHGINLLGLLTLFFCYRKGTERFRKQSVLFLASTFIPIFNTEAYFVNIASDVIDITPYGLLISMVIFVLALYRFGVFNAANIIKEKSINYLHEGVLLFDMDGVYVDANLSAREIFPQLATIKLGTNIRDMDYLPFNTLTMAADNSGHICEFTTENNNFIKTFNVSISQIYQNSKCIGYGVILNNITQLKKLFADLEEKSIKDALTGAYNRGYLFEVGQHNIENAKRRCEPFSVIMFDIDFFKTVNDTFGHMFGDYVLKNTITLCSENLRRSDLIARYGGEEFCILLLNTPLEGALLKAEVLRRKISEHIFKTDEHKTQLTASFGVATYTAEDEDFLNIVKRADENLYRAKRSGRNKVV